MSQLRVFKLLSYFVTLYLGVQTLRVLDVMAESNFLGPSHCIHDCHKGMLLHEGRYSTLQAVTGVSVLSDRNPTSGISRGLWTMLNGEMWIRELPAWRLRTCIYAPPLELLSRICMSDRRMQPGTKYPKCHRCSPTKAEQADNAIKRLCHSAAYIAHTANSQRII